MVNIFKICVGGVSALRVVRTPQHRTRQVRRRDIHRENSHEESLGLGQVELNLQSDVHVEEQFVLELGVAHVPPLRGLNIIFDTEFVISGKLYSTRIGRCGGHLTG